MRKALPLLFALSLAACAHKPPLATTEVPAGYDVAAARDAGAWPDATFWQGFNSAELQALLAEAERNNTDLAAAAARITQAQGALGVAASSLFPSLSVGADAAENGSKGRSANGLTTGSDKWSSSKSFSASAGASYEVDLWGKNRARRRSAKASLVATQFDRQTVALTVSAGVANNYLSVLSIRDRLAIARANLDNALRVLAIVQSRVKNGAASPLDLAQQDGVVAQQRAAIPALVQDERFARTSLAVLLGRPPEGFDVAGGALDKVTSPHLAPGLPSDLLLRRPDIRSAEWALKGTEADVDAARAAFFPQIDLTGSGGLQSTALATLFSGAGGFYTIAASLTQPIFQGGALAGALKQAQGRRAEALATYRGVVFQSFADVENALGDIGNQSDQLRYRADQTDAAGRAFRIAEAQYREGVTDFLTVLDAQRTLYAAQDSLAQAKLAALQADVTLFRVLGGGWPAK